MALTPDDRRRLISAVEQVRGPFLVRPYGVTRSSKFWRAETPIADLRRFSIIHHFGYAGLSLGEFAEKVMRDPPAPAEAAMQQEVLEMIQVVKRGGQLNGTPIAVIRPAPQLPLLIEGYKRSIVAIAEGRASTPMLCCEP